MGVGDRIQMPEIVRAQDGKIIGHIEGGVFLKRVKASVHQLQRPPGWAIDCKAFWDHIRFQCSTIRIEDIESGTVYEIDTKVFDRQKVYFDRKFGAQYFCPMKYWHQIRKGQKALL